MFSTKWISILRAHDKRREEKREEKREATINSYHLQPKNGGGGALSAKGKPPPPYTHTVHTDLQYPIPYPITQATVPTILSQQLKKKNSHKQPTPHFPPFFHQPTNPSNPSHQTTQHRSTHTNLGHKEIRRNLTYDTTQTRACFSNSSSSEYRSTYPSRNVRTTSPKFSFAFPCNSFFSSQSWDGWDRRDERMRDGCLWIRIWIRLWDTGCSSMWGCCNHLKKGS